jgi:hypothetical protein
MSCISLLEDARTAGRFHLISVRDVDLTALEPFAETVAATRVLRFWLGTHSVLRHGGVEQRHGDVCRAAAADSSTQGRMGAPGLHGTS